MKGPADTAANPRLRLGLPTRRRSRKAPRALSSAADIEAVYDAYGSRCYALALTILRDKQLAREVVQNVFHSLANGTWRVDETDGDLGLQLITHTHRRTVDILRSHPARVPTRTAEPPVDLMAEQGCADPDVGRVRAAVQALPEAEKSAILLAYFGGLTLAKTAEHLRVDVSEVKAQQLRGMRQLRVLLATHPERVDDA